MSVADFFFKITLREDSTDAVGAFGSFTGSVRVMFRKTGAAIDFKPLDQDDRLKLTLALRGNADQGLAILMNRRNTSFAGTASDVPDEEVINAIRSVPCHYADE